MLIGGMAAIAHGSPFPTADIDITPDTELANMQRLSDALTELGARVWFSDTEDPVLFAHDATSLTQSGVWNLVTEFGRIDLSLIPNGTEGYLDLAQDAVDAEVVGVVISIASLADIIRSKQAANRPKDQRVLPTLRRILAERHRTQP